MSTIVNADCGQVLGIVDGRDPAAVGRLAVRPQPGVAGPDRGRRDRSVGGVLQGRRQRPSHAKVSVDGFHLVQLANLMVTRVRQRLVRDREQRRGRLVDPAWANRRLLLRGYNTLSARAQAASTSSSPPTTPPRTRRRVGGKEQVRRLLKVSTVEQARHEKMIMGCYVMAAGMDETCDSGTP